MNTHWPLAHVPVPDTQRRKIAEVADHALATADIGLLGKVVMIYPDIVLLELIANGVALLGGQTVSRDDDGRSAHILQLPGIATDIATGHTSTP